MSQVKFYRLWLFKITDPCLSPKPNNLIHNIHMTYDYLIEEKGKKDDNREKKEKQGLEFCAEKNYCQENNSFFVVMHGLYPSKV